MEKKVQKPKAEIKTWKSKQDIKLFINKEVGAVTFNKEDELSPELEKYFTQKQKEQYFYK